MTGKFDDIVYIGMANLCLIFDGIAAQESLRVGGIHAYIWIHVSFVALRGAFLRTPPKYGMRKKSATREHPDMMFTSKGPGIGVMEKRT